MLIVVAAFLLEKGGSDISGYISLVKISMLHEVFCWWSWWYTEIFRLPFFMNTDYGCGYIVRKKYERKREDRSILCHSSYHSSLLVALQKYSFMNKTTRTHTAHITVPSLSSSSMVMTRQGTLNRQFVSAARLKIVHQVVGFFCALAFWNRSMLFKNCNLLQILHEPWPWLLHMQN